VLMLGSKSRWLKSDLEEASAKKPDICNSVTSLHLHCRSLISLFPRAEPDVTTAKAAAKSPSAAPVTQEGAATGTP